MVAWAVLACLARALLFALRLEALVPHALLFANPVLLQVSATTTGTCGRHTYIKGGRQTADVPIIDAYTKHIQWFRHHADHQRRGDAHNGSGDNGSGSGGGMGGRSNGGGKLARAQGLAACLLPRLAPNLPVRIAESLLGRTASVLVVIPAHFMGGIMGVAIARLLFAGTELAGVAPPTQVGACEVTFCLRW